MAEPQLTTTNLINPIWDIWAPWALKLLTTTSNKLTRRIRLATMTKWVAESQLCTNRALVTITMEERPNISNIHLCTRKILSTWVLTRRILPITTLLSLLWTLLGSTRPLIRQDFQQVQDSLVSKPTRCLWCNHQAQILPWPLRELTRVQCTQSAQEVQAGTLPVQQEPWATVDLQRMYRVVLLSIKQLVVPRILPLDRLGKIFQPEEVRHTILMPRTTLLTVMLSHKLREFEPLIWFKTTSFNKENEVSEILFIVVTFAFL